MVFPVESLRMALARKFETRILLSPIGSSLGIDVLALHLPRLITNVQIEVMQTRSLVPNVHYR